MLVTTSSSEKIQLETKAFHSGGEGELYRIVSPLKFKDKCVKIYYSHYQDKGREGKLNYMIRNRPSQIQFSSDFKICWADDLIFLNGKFVGFIMPFAFSDSIQLYEICTTKINSRIQKIFHDKFDRKNPKSLENRLKLCVNIAIAIHCIHETGIYVFVDLKPQNILIDSTGKVSIVDLDSLQVAKNSNIIHHGHVATPEYTPIEGTTLNPSINFIPATWDYFSMAVIFYEIIFGLHPYVATSLKPYEHLTTIQDAIKNGLFVFGSRTQYLKPPPQHDNFKHVPENIKKSFFDAFDRANGSPLLRPSAQDWGKILVEEVAKETEKVNLNCPFCGKLITVSKHNNMKTNCNGCDATVDFRKGKLFGYSREKVVTVNKTVYKDKEVIVKNDSRTWKILTIILVIILFLALHLYQNEINIMEKKSLEIHQMNNEILSYNDNISSLEIKNKNLELVNERLEGEVKNLNERLRLVNNIELNKNFVKALTVSSVGVGMEFGQIDIWQDFLASEVIYLYPRIVISFPLIFQSSLPQNVEFFIKFYGPDKTLMVGENSPAGYSFSSMQDIFENSDFISLNGWGYSSGGSFKVGKHIIEVWVNGELKGSTTFKIR
ncbi:hypothetical protein P872_06215 [Rhodonellum psychrophilum GCM71 = DSM 17998]|uniref:Protein kinase domain-containing protein n=2 Tax=Rhodonellum TaxID=336827 RepID=U5BR47_9BACT|nr:MULTISPECIES: protein kinase [Rhodonellum]ERM83065.1 hypothetical protein P872_06215 [Rhodonellum psychrophilum GCM71 = DSM 17998]SDZ47196.1 Protein kinase domain-containing protein [Rhodonellum ikkaensis]